MLYHAISTHAPRTGSDRIVRLLLVQTQNFNPRSPHGERHRVYLLANAKCRFQPTLPARGATQNDRRSKNWSAISTHAPRTGSDDMPLEFHADLSISTHAPRTGSDITSKGTMPSQNPFQPTLPARGATISAEITRKQAEISTHAPRTGSDKGRLRGS